MKCSKRLVGALVETSLQEPARKRHQRLRTSLEASRPRAHRTTLQSFLDADSVESFKQPLMVRKGDPIFFSQEVAISDASELQQRFMRKFSSSTPIYVAQRAFFDRYGFILLDHQSPVFDTHFKDPTDLGHSQMGHGRCYDVCTYADGQNKAVESEYLAELRGLLESELGLREHEVGNFQGGLQFRYTGESPEALKGVLPSCYAAAAQGGAFTVHQDFGATAPHYKQQLLHYHGQEMADKWERDFQEAGKDPRFNGFAIVNAWRVLNKTTLENEGLCLLDPVSLKSGDAHIMEYEGRGNRPVLATQYALKGHRASVEGCRADHKWYSYAMDRHKVLLFKTFACDRNGAAELHSSGSLTTVFHSAYAVGTVKQRASAEAKLRLWPKKVDNASV